MKHSLKRIISFAFVLILVLSFATPAFAAGGKVFYQQGAITVGMDYYYEYSDWSSGSLKLTLAEGPKKFNIDRSSISVDPGTAGAELQGFNLQRNDTRNITQNLTKGKWKTSTSSTYKYFYELSLFVEREGTATVRYSVDGTPYTVNLTITRPVNPLKSVTITGVNNGKNLAEVNDTYYDKVSQSANTVKKAKLKVAASEGWVIRELHMYDESTGFQRGKVDTNFSNTLKTATINWGKLQKSHSYQIIVELFNTKTHTKLDRSFSING